MNPSQYYGILRIVLPAAIAFVVGKGWISQDAVTQLFGVLAAVVGASGISASVNTTSSLAQVVAATKDSEGQPAVKIMVAPTAPQPLLDLATDTSVPEIVHAASVAPSAPPPKDPIYPPPDHGPYATKRRQS
jgi:hypothetical protein